MRKVLEAAENLHLREGMAVDLAMGPNDDVEGIVTHFGMCFGAKAVVLTTGTFMNGTIWVGRKQLPAGRCALLFLFQDGSHTLNTYLGTGPPALWGRASLGISLLSVLYTWGTVMT
jgi:tRNA uridine 5-carboxymethylaminomethyl modification enzyme